MEEREGERYMEENKGEREGEGDEEDEYKGEGDMEEKENEGEREGDGDEEENENKTERGKLRVIKKRKKVNWRERMCKWKYTFFRQEKINAILYQHYLSRPSDLQLVGREG